jgi:2-keto-4-pentenoate hydratase/2-oxohepta-3-ene-1,7-dioic acid hydratase in catechol pathway
MRIARVDFGDEIRPAVAHGAHWLRADSCLGGGDDLLVEDVLSAPDRLQDALAAVDVSVLQERGHAVPLDGASLDTPLLGGRSIIAVGLNYRLHADEVAHEAPPAPLLFAKWSSSLTGPSGVIPTDSALTTQLDYEVELAVVIGKRAKKVAAEKAFDYVAGYAVANDISARDLQFSDGQWTRAKSFDGFCPLGPWITTVDEIPDPQQLTLSCSVNGVVRQQDSTAHMLHPVADLIAYITRGITLEPGDVILTGTPAGVAMGMEQPQWLQPGDVVRTEVSGLGVLTNEVVAAD